MSSSLTYLIYLRVKLCLECLIKIVSSSLTISVCQAILWMIDSDNWFYLQSISFNMLELSLYHQVFLKILDSDSVKKLHDTWVVNIKEYRCLTSKHFNDNVVFSQSCSWFQLMQLVSTPAVRFNSCSWFQLMQLVSTPAVGFNSCSWFQLMQLVSTHAVGFNSCSWFQLTFSQSCSWFQLTTFFLALSISKKKQGYGF